MTYRGSVTMFMRRAGWHVTKLVSPVFGKTSVADTVKPKHGGAGRGQGRKQIGPEPRKRICISLPESHRQKAMAIGEGNVSLGISRAVESYPETALAPVEPSDAAPSPNIPV